MPSTLRAIYEYLFSNLLIERIFFPENWNFALSFCKKEIKVINNVRINLVLHLVFCGFVEFCVCSLSCRLFPWTWEMTPFVRPVTTIYSFFLILSIKWWLDIGILGRGDVSIYWRYKASSLLFLFRERADHTSHMSGPSLAPAPILFSLPVIPLFQMPVLCASVPLHQCPPPTLSPACAALQPNTSVIQRIFFPRATCFSKVIQNK